MTKLEEFILANPEVLAAAGVGRNGGSTPTYEECPDCHLPKGHLDGHGGGGSNPSGKNPSDSKPDTSSSSSNKGSINVDFGQDKDGLSTKVKVSQKVGSWEFGAEGGYSEKDKWTGKASVKLSW